MLQESQFSSSSLLHNIQYLAHDDKEVLNRLIVATSCLSPASFCSSRHFSGTARACSFCQVISSRRGGGTSNLDATLHCWIEKQLCKHDCLQRHVAIATLLPGVDRTDVKWRILRACWGHFICMYAFSGLPLGLMMHLQMEQIPALHSVQIHPILLRDADGLDETHVIIERVNLRIQE